LLRWVRHVRPQDPVWILLFAALAYTLPDPDFYSTAPLAALALVQLAEPRISALDSSRRRGFWIVWIVAKVALAYIFIGYTGAITSRYWYMMLLPVVSAATTLGLIATLLFALVAASAYLSFVLFLHGMEDISEYLLRAIFLAMIGVLANTLAEELRQRSRQHRHTAEQLAEANLQIREAEDAVRRSDRLAALGQLSAGLAHELRNPLGTIRTSSEMLGRSVAAENEVAREMAGFIASEVDRANSLITRFLQFARPVELRLENADLPQVLDRAIALVKRETAGIAIYTNYTLDIPPFPLDAELMERVFYNLILNAVQATAPGGAVTVKTRAVGGGAEVSVIDRGSGIEPKHLETIFNPFFTTKPEGVGLGLAIVAKIVDEHGGKITVESERGQGSVFRVLLPVERSVPAASA
jgi:two-component system sensor histidine kinase HydH